MTDDPQGSSAHTPHKTLIDALRYAAKWHLTAEKMQDQGELADAVNKAAAALEAALADTRRIDYLEREQLDRPVVIVDDDYWPVGWWSGKHDQPYFPTLREAIDAAMASEVKGRTPAIDKRPRGV
jgi:hypothetical protein